MHLSYSNTRLSTHSTRGGVSVIREIDVETGVWKEDTDAVALVIIMVDNVVQLTGEHWGPPHRARCPTEWGCGWQ